MKKRLKRPIIFWTFCLFVLLSIAWWYGSMLKIPGKSYRGPLLPLTSSQIETRDRLKIIVQTLAGDIGERNVWRPLALRKAADYVEHYFQQLGYSVQSQHFRTQGVTVRNIEVTLPGKTQEVIVVGAHYDSAPGSPGADDNATGVAVLLEMARRLKHKQFARTIRLVAFVNEESPYFFTGEMGSYHYAKRAYKNKENIAGMISLESLGFYSEQKNSQRYPYPFIFKWFYPNQGDFISFVGNVKSYRLVHRAIAAFRQHTQFPSEGIAAPSFIEGVAWSDQWSFWKMGYPAIMVTDTALFRNPNYHTKKDTPETLDYNRLARVTGGLVDVISTLAN